MGAARSKYSVVLMGLDHAGKTSLLYHLAGRPGDFSPTVGYNYQVVEQVYNRTKFQFHIFDLAGSLHSRPLWRHFYRNLKPNVVLFVVDATDRVRLSEAKKELHNLLHEVDLLESELIILDNIKRLSHQRGGRNEPAAPGSQNLRNGATDGGEDVDPLRESDIRFEMDVPRHVPVLEVNAHEPSELNRLMHQICQQLIKIK